MKLKIKHIMKLSEKETKITKQNQKTSKQGRIMSEMARHGTIVHGVLVFGSGATLVGSLGIG